MTARSFLLGILIVLLTACAAQPPVDSVTAGPEEPVSGEPVRIEPGQSDAPAHSILDPLPGEESMKRGIIMVESSELLILESYPLQINLAVKGSLPTPCHLPRAAFTPPDAEGVIAVELYSLVAPDVICIQTVQPIEVTIPLGSFPDGKYSVLLNGNKAGEFSQ
ncbi:MAG: hypothetical protein L0Z70_10650 [Chloroflexi bacterium]|nr:hypothetical protein [Chloroflexota bacterium]